MAMVNEQLLHEEIFQLALHSPYYFCFDPMTEALNPKIRTQTNSNFKISTANFNL